MSVKNSKTPFLPPSPLALRLAAAALLAAGIALPQVWTLSDYTYKLVGTAATLGYAVAAALAALALFDEHIPHTVARKLQTVGLAALCLLTVWSASQASAGLHWFNYQIAADMSTWAAVDADAYWSKLYQLAGLSPGQSVFNDLRTMHARFGPAVTLNGAQVFYDTIWQLSEGQVQELLALPGGGYAAVPVGSGLILAALLLHAYAWFRERGSAPPIATSTQNRAAPDSTNSAFTPS